MCMTVTCVCSVLRGQRSLALIPWGSLVVMVTAGMYRGLRQVSKKSNGPSFLFAPFLTTTSIHFENLP